MTRVELVVQATIERYDEGGNLTASQPTQPVKLAAATPEAMARALDGLRGQLAAAWEIPPPPEEGK